MELSKKDNLLQLRGEGCDVLYCYNNNKVKVCLPQISEALFSLPETKHENI
jgi:hypothetical protein